MPSKKGAARTSPATQAFWRETLKNGGGNGGTFPVPSGAQKEGPSQLVVTMALALAGELGFEPRLTDPEAPVTPNREGTETLIGRYLTLILASLQALHYRKNTSIFPQKKAVLR
jgi:hypothetical protein